MPIEENEGREDPAATPKIIVQTALTIIGQRNIEFDSPPDDKGSVKINLTEADLQKANLQKASLQEANLQAANRYKANLKGANIILKQLETAKVFKNTVLPEHIDKTKLGFMD